MELTAWKHRPEPRHSLKKKAFCTTFFVFSATDSVRMPYLCIAFSRHRPVSEMFFRNGKFKGLGFPLFIAAHLFGVRVRRFFLPFWVVSALKKAIKREYNLKK